MDGCGGGTQLIVRGTTVEFNTTFYDADSNVTQPDNAAINIVPAMTQVPVTVAMVPPGPGSVQWTAMWDTRDIPPGAVYFSIHTGVSNPVPVVVEDGMFMLAANPANLPTF